MRGINRLPPSLNRRAMSTQVRGQPVRRQDASALEYDALRRWISRFRLDSGDFTANYGIGLNTGPRGGRVSLDDAPETGEDALPTGMVGTE